MNKIELDEFQRAFVDFEHKPNQVCKLEAVAGSGKTTCSVLKIKKIIEESSFLPSEIVFITFSNRAAKDLTRKYKTITGLTEKPYMSTVHSFSVALLDKYFDIRGTILNEWSSILVMRDALESLGLDEAYDCKTKRDLTSLAVSILNVISWYKSTLQSHIPILESDFENYSYVDEGGPGSTLNPRDLESVFKEYERFKKSGNLFDYDDLPFILYTSLQSNPQVVDSIQRDFPVFFIDECQDLDSLMFHLVYKLSAGKNLFLIYDVAQTIYGFRWSAPQMLEDDELEGRFKHISTFSLRYNYRSTENIVSVSNIARAIAGSSLVSIPSKKRVQGSSRLITVGSNLNEGAKIASLIKERASQGCSYNDICVISRTNSYLKTIVEPHLIKEGIPYNLLTKSRKKILEKPLIKSYFNMINYLVSDSGGFSILDIAANIQGIGPSYLDKLRKESYSGIALVASDKKKSKILRLLDTLESLKIYSEPSDLICILRAFSDIVKLHFVENFTTEKELDLINKALTTMVFGYYDEHPELRLRDIFSRVLLDFTELEGDPDQGNTVKLMTVHATKGLEFPVTMVGDFSRSRLIKEDPFDASCILHVQLSRAIDQLLIIQSRSFVDRRFGTSKAKHSGVYLEFVDQLCG